MIARLRVRDALVDGKLMQRIVKDLQYLLKSKRPRSYLSIPLIYGMINNDCVLMALIMIRKIAMPLTVITVKTVPPSLRGDLTKWMQEIATGVYVGNFNSKVREELWERVKQCRYWRSYHEFFLSKRNRISVRHISNSVQSD